MPRQTACSPISSSISTRIEKSLEDHRFIVRALKMRNPDAVAAAFSEHILRIHDTSRAVGESAPGTVTRQPGDPVPFKPAGRP
jgi:DNA-binding FadR family transcriptional regulator